MESFSREIIIPSVDQICEVNRRMIHESGGRFEPPKNLLNITSLEYILDAITYPLYDIDIFPSLKEKAAALAFEIIVSHIFFDGNKRTGIHIAWEFLQSNGVDVYLDISVENLAVRVGDGDASRDELLSWLHDHQGTSLKN